MTHYHTASPLRGFDPEPPAGGYPTAYDGPGLAALVRFELEVGMDSLSQHAEKASWEEDYKAAWLAHQREEALAGYHNEISCHRHRSRYFVVRGLDWQTFSLERSLELDRTPTDVTEIRVWECDHPDDKCESALAHPHEADLTDDEKATLTNYIARMIDAVFDIGDSCEPFYVGEFTISKDGHSVAWFRYEDGTGYIAGE